MPTKAEAIQSVLRGQHGGLAPEFLRDDQAHRLINVDVRGGKATSRPALVAKDFPIDGRFQGAFTYRLQGTDRVVAVVSGNVLIYNVAEDAWSNVATFPTTDFEQAFFCQADKYLIIQNGIYSPVENWPIIIHEDAVIDNLDAKANTDEGFVPISERDNPDIDRIPIGKPMTFVHGRLFVGVERYWEDGSASGEDPHWHEDGVLLNWVAGDVKIPYQSDTLLAFVEKTYWNNLPVAGVPAELGPITSLIHFRNAATGSGAGELVIISREGATAFSVGISREQWSNTNFAQVLFSTGGSVAPWSALQVNSDLVYYGSDGFRSIRYTASTEAGSGSLSTTPISTEVKEFTDLTSGEHARFVSMANADNYVAATAVGVPLADGSVAFRAVLPWDVAVVTGSGAQPERAFSGAWTGELYHSVLSFRDTTNTNVFATVYRDHAEAPLKLGTFTRDMYNEDQVSRVYSKKFMFDSLVEVKQFKFAECAFSDIRTPLAVRIGWRVDNDNAWHWLDGVEFQADSYPAASGPVRLAVPRRDVLACFNERLVDSGYSFQFVIEWTGHGVLDYSIFNTTSDGASSSRDQVCGVKQLTPSVGEALDPLTELESLEDN